MSFSRQVPSLYYYYYYYYSFKCKYISQEPSSIFTLNSEPVGYNEILASVCEITWLHITGDRNLYAAVNLSQTDPGTMEFVQLQAELRRAFLLS
jgi:hypothetical protein